MSTIEDSIQELQDTTIQHQTAINSIQATLAVQQNDIAAIKASIIDIRLSINLIINSLSDLATKLGFQISLPPPLPLSPTPQTPLPATDCCCLPACHFLAPPTPPPVAASSDPTLLTTAAVGSKPLASSPPKISANQAAPTPKAILPTPPPLAPSAPPSSILWFTTNVNPFFLEIQVVAIIINNNVHLIKHLLNPNATFAYSQYLNESKPLIFDPGGKIELECYLVARFIHDDTSSYLMFTVIFSSFGTICFSGMVMSIIKVVCTIIDSAEREEHAGFVNSVLNCCSMFPLSSLDFVKKFTVTFAGIAGEAYCSTAKMTYDLLKPLRIAGQKIYLIVAHAWLAISRSDCIPNKQEIQLTILIGVHNFEFESNSVISCTNTRGCIIKICHNPDSTTSILLPPTYDLEDKVDFEGSVMIRLHMQQYANARSRRTTRLPSRYKG